MDRPDLAGGFLFESFCLERWGLSRLCPDGVAEPVALGSRALDLLLLLVEHHGEVVPKDNIMQAVWRRTAVEEANLTMQISTLAASSTETGNKGAVSTLCPVAAIGSRPP